MSHATEIEIGSQTEYIALEFNANATASMHLSDSFRWLTRIIQFFPMWTTAASKKGIGSKAHSKSSSKWVSAVIICLIAIAIIYHGVIETISVLTLFWQHDRPTYHAMVALLELFATLSRFCSLYYFHRHFEFPWNAEFEPQSHDQITTQQRKAIAKYKWFILITFAAVMLTEILNLSVYLYFSAILHSACYYWIGYSLGKVFVFVPLLVTIAAAAVIFAKYHVAVLQITEAWQSSLRSADRCIDFECVQHEYHAMRRQFEADYVPSLQWCLLLYLVAIALELWLFSYALVNGTESVELFLKLCRFFGGFGTLLLFFVSASWMTETFVAFESSVHEYGVTHSNEVELDYGRLNYLVSYMTRHPLVVRIGGTFITKRSSISIIVVFVSAKLFGFMIGSIV